MKIKDIVFIGSVLLSFNSYAQEVLFSVGDNEVTAEEFKAVYEKNKDVGSLIDPKTPQEYLDLYVKFKLKIAEAYDQQRDTASQFVKEFGGYRAQLAKPYLSDPGSEKTLITEGYARLQEEVKASHIMFELESTALPSDTVKVFNEMKNLRNEITSGKISFEDAARSKSADTWSAKQGGDLGYFTAFNMVYPFENGAYNQNIGEISMPIRSQFGYHLIKTTDRRPASGTVKVRQIFFSADEEAKINESQRAERSAQEIFNRLQTGEDFVSLVSFSEDRKTKESQGVMPEFGLNKMMPAFEEAAFALKSPGDYSMPIRTNIGWHVIQLMERIPLPEFATMEKEITNKVKRDSRSKLGAVKFLKDLKKQYNFSVNERNYARTVKLVSTTAFTEGQWQAVMPSKDRVVATFDGQAMTQSQLLDFWQQNQKPGNENDVEEYLRLLFNVVSNDVVLGYEDGKLETKYPAFRNLVREYKEGILLFDLTQDEVWDKASQDSVGIFNHYEEIKTQFMWNDRLAYAYWVCEDEKIAKKISKWVSKDKQDKLNELLGAENPLSIAVQSGTSQQDDDEVLSVLWNTIPGVYGPVLLTGGFGVIQVIDFIPAGPKALNEVKGLVIASYQDQLEQAWVKKLTAKFEVIVNDTVKNELFNSLD